MEVTEKNIDIKIILLTQFMHSDLIYTSSYFFLNIRKKYIKCIPEAFRRAYFYYKEERQNKNSWLVQ